VGVVDLIVTELAVIEVTPEGLLLREVAAGVTPEAVQKVTEPALLRAPDLKTISISL
jgi:acyl CoA:acetate/3-ketoacid CoA transferase beta subunit